MVHLWSVRRLYSSFTARQKTVRFILRTISRTYGQLKAPFRRQLKRYFGRDFLRISFIFYGFTKINYRGYIQAVLFFKVPLVYNYSTCYTEEFSIYFFYILQFYFLYIFIFYSFISYILIFLVLSLMYFLYILRLY